MCMYLCVRVCMCVCVCPCGTQTLVLQGDNIFYNKTTVNVNPIGHNDWISLPPQRWWQWFLRCLLVTDKFLNKIIRFGALQSALLDYWLSTKISCPADVWVCGQHSKWAKTALSGRGEPPKSLLASSAAEDYLWAPTCRPLQLPPNHEGPGSRALVFTARTSHVVWLWASLCPSLSLLSRVEKAAIRLNNVRGPFQMFYPHTIQ